MPTARGWVTGVGAGAALIAGRVFGLIDVFAAGVGLGAAVVLAIAYVHLGQTSVKASRRIQPPRVHAGGSSRVELSIVNTSNRRSPVLRAGDPFDGGTRWARFLIAPLLPGEAARAAYRLPTDHRGVYDLGPLTVRRVDPLGLATSSVEAAPKTRLTVYPRVDPIDPLPSQHGQDPLAGSDHPHALAGPGDDFYALRPYVRGDDLRRVHWPSTARTDDLMIRQDEMPWQGRATVAVDTRAESGPPEAFELVLSAAASIAMASRSHQSLLRLVTTGGYDSGFGAGRAHVDDLLEHLAGAEADQGSFPRLLARLHRGGGGLAVVTTALVRPEDLQSLTGLPRRYPGVMVVLFQPSSWSRMAGSGPGHGPLLDGALAGPRLVSVTGNQPFGLAWNHAVRALEPGSGARQRTFGTRQRASGPARGGDVRR